MLDSQRHDRPPCTPSITHRHPCRKHRPPPPPLQINPIKASPYKSAYNAAKHGIAGFTKTVALELAQKNVTCNAICPGYVLTGGLRGGRGGQRW